MYFVEGEKNSKLQAVPDGNNKGVPTPIEYSTNEIIEGKTVR